MVSHREGLNERHLGLVAPYHVWSAVLSQAPAGVKPVQARCAGMFVVVRLLPQYEGALSCCYGLPLGYPVVE